MASQKDVLKIVNGFEKQRFLSQLSYTCMIFYNS